MNFTLEKNIKIANDYSKVVGRAYNQQRQQANTSTEGDGFSKVIGPANNQEADTNIGGGGVSKVVAHANNLGADTNTEGSGVSKAVGYANNQEADTSIEEGGFTNAFGCANNQKAKTNFQRGGFSKVVGRANNQEADTSIEGVGVSKVVGRANNQEADTSIKGGVFSKVVGHANDQADTSVEGNVPILEVTAPGLTLSPSTFFKKSSKRPSTSVNHTGVSCKYKKPRKRSPGAHNINPAMRSPVNSERRGKSTTKIIRSNPKEHPTAKKAAPATSDHAGPPANRKAFTASKC